MGDFVTDYIKSIENPDRIGWNGKVWGAPTLKGYDVNQRGYGIDIRYNNAAKNLVKNRKGLWLTDKEVTDLMNLHLLYITGVAKRKIKGFNTFSPKKQAAILGMLYRGDSVQSNVNVNEPNDNKFLNAVHTYYKNKGLNQRMLNSINFFSKYLKGGLIRKMLTAAGGPIRLSPEQIASFEYIPGMNNSGMLKFRKEEVLALQHKILEAKKKEEEIKSRMEMKPVLEKKASVIERFKGEKDKYEQQPQVVGMSGADPVGQFVVETVALEGLGKLGLWGATKYAPNTWLGNKGRKYFVGDILKSLSFSKFVNPDNTINVNNSIEAIKDGKNWAIQYLLSEAKKLTNQYNEQLAHRLGFKNFKSFNKASQRVSVPNKLKIINELKNLEGGSVWTDPKNPALDEITINVSLNPYYSSIHENLHRGYVGNAPKEYYLNEPRGTFGDTNRFYEWLKEKTLKPWSERHNLPGADYLDKPEELAVNLIEAGQRMGLKIGLLYPGKKEALELMEKYRSSGDYKSGIIDLLNLSHPKRAWKGLTGTLFSLPLIYGYTGLKNTQ